MCRAKYPRRESLIHHVILDTSATKTEKKFSKKKKITLSLGE